ncbi:HAD-IC family P-type ATPase [Gordonia pseudamarae]|uniref:HAD-IC family P-type ATPase n=1 Tax=Gordonia pseudamarae TaxID=2831662 RepID=A0ABX6IMA0_9ACTN|nr:MULTISPECIES: cation-translocating P-type ATPase [Gordonia]MBD0022150.1 cation-translocating P-type ATPase [Gordonia sp. (in: high G+C Gram-positive bacteria)]QHN28168.1 HAD-IC family P-type ATPase [Gordonia pseudamarae]QHN37029.1 HAD-IC family P-type ATPase [Gordonia pseudamarae]
MSLLSAPITLSKIAVGAALLGGDAIVEAGRKAGSTAAATAGGVGDELAAIGVAVIGTLGEAVGGPPARRRSSTATTRWIEVRGLDTAFDKVSTEVHAALSGLPGVVDVQVNGPLSRVLVTVDEGGPSADELAQTVSRAEKRTLTHLSGTTPRPARSLPGDDNTVAAGLLGTCVASAALVGSLVTSLLPVPRISRIALAPITVAAHHPRVRGMIEDRLGGEATELLLAGAQVTGQALAAAPLGVAVNVSSRAIATAEALNGRRAWRRVEPTLADRARKDGRLPYPTVPDARSVRTGRRSDEIAVDAGLGGAAILAVTASPLTAAEAVLVAAPTPARSVRQAFGASLGRGLHARGAVVLNPQSLRTLGDIDTLLVDPRVLFTAELAVTRVIDVDNGDRARTWRAATAALESGLLKPGWNTLADVPGQALVSPLRRPLATAFLAGARRAGLRVVSLVDDGLHSLRQGFDELLDSGSDPDTALERAVTRLRADGATVALVCNSGSNAIRLAHTGIGIIGEGSAPWGADILVDDLTAAWRVIHAIPVAREANQRAVSLASGASLLGSLMLIPGVRGDGPTSVNATALFSLWHGYHLGTKVFTEPDPLPDSSHDWYALPIDEVLRLLPRPERPAPADTFIAPVARSAPIRLARASITDTVDTLRDFRRTMAEDLADPITPILATGSAASALLGSPVDAVMVAGVLAVNTAISAYQSLHAEKLLEKMLAVQEPLARRVIGEPGTHGYDEVPAGDLRPGDIVEVRSGEVVPADIRIIDADTVEVDESTLTGESLPVSKDGADTPGAPQAERTGMLFAGSTVVAGKSVGVVTAAGESTQVSRALALAPSSSGEVGLAAQLGAITRRALPFSLAGGALVGVLSLLRGTPIREAASGTVGIGVAAVPEGLPLVVTLAQSSSARNLTGSSVLVRNPRAIEAFARLDAVCFDKTGTLSENRLRVAETHGLLGATTAEVLRAAGATMRISKSGKVEHATDAAIHRAAEEAGIDHPAVDAFLPFQSDRPLAAALVGNRLLVKGAPEELAAALEPGHRDELREALQEMAARGLRVLTVAERWVTDEQAHSAADDPDAFARLCGSSLHLLGVIGLSDTPRAGARPLLEELQRRGIEVRLITGDHPVTAAVIAGDLGIAVERDEVMTGPEWDLLNATERVAATRTHRVFARMAPEHKVQVVQALETPYRDRRGLVTAMVGDGANDAAAIRAASVGVGVVSQGSDPARMAADVMLLDGDIEAIIDALDEGEQLWRRVQSAVSVLLGHNVGEVTFGLVTTVLTGKPALNARQMLLVNMLTDALPAAALAVSPQRDPDVAGRHDESTIWRAVAVRAVFTSLGALLAWAFGRATGTASRAATIGLIGLVVTQMIETLTDSHGPLVVATNIGTLAVMALIISVPGVSQMFGCTPVGPVGWAQAFAAAGIAAGVSKMTPQLVDWLIARFLESEADPNGALHRVMAALDSAEGTGEDLAAWLRRVLVSDNGRLLVGDNGRLLVDAEDTDTDEHSVQMLDGGRQQPSTRFDQGIGPDSASELRHNR